jgi:hypothetical protein
MFAEAGGGAGSANQNPQEFGPLKNCLNLTFY